MIVLNLEAFVIDVDNSGKISVVVVDISNGVLRNTISLKGHSKADALRLSNSDISKPTIVWFENGKLKLNLIGSTKVIELNGIGSAEFEILDSRCAHPQNLLHVLVNAEGVQLVYAFELLPDSGTLVQSAHVSRFEADDCLTMSCLSGSPVLTKSNSGLNKFSLFTTASDDPLQEWQTSREVLSPLFKPSFVCHMTCHPLH